MVHAPSIYDWLGSSAHIPTEIQSLVLASLVVLLIAALVSTGLRSAAESGLIPDEKITLRNLLELLMEGVVSLARGIIGEHWARYMPLIGTLGFFILVSNLMGLIPGLGGPTAFFETNLAWALVAFIVSEVAGFMEHGPVNYLKHFASGPWWIAWFIFLVEVFSHLVRVFSLTLRLTANMFADHTLLAIALVLPFVSWFLPWAVLGLGVFVAVVQAFIFAFLTMIYIGLAVEHAH
jgi:F-type H+-transporting ATPase subunit a